jgi:hypothetical protein
MGGPEIAADQRYVNSAQQLSANVRDSVVTAAPPDLSAAARFVKTTAIYDRNRHQKLAKGATAAVLPSTRVISNWQRRVVAPHG